MGDAPQGTPKTEAMYEAELVSKGGKAMNFLSCKVAARLLSEKLDRELPLIDRIVLRIHLLICSVCRTHRKQLGILHQAIEHLSKEDLSLLEDESCELSEAAKSRMREALRKASIQNEKSESEGSCTN